MSKIFRGDHETALLAGDLIVVGVGPDHSGLGRSVSVSLRRDDRVIPNWQISHLCPFPDSGYDACLKSIALAAGMELIEESVGNQTEKLFRVQKPLGEETSQAEIAGQPKSKRAKCGYCDHSILQDGVHADWTEDCPYCFGTGFLPGS